MGALVAAYVLVWLAVQMHVVWLGVRQRQLDARLDALAAKIEQWDQPIDSVAHAA
jgi:CcmD family protein